MREEIKGQHGRFKAAPWYDPTVRILIGGAGGIGSWTALLLSRSGYQIISVDFDEVEIHNLGGQVFSNTHIGKAKVEALKEIILALSDETITALPDKINANSMTNKIVIAAFDNIAARKDMFNAWKKTYAGNPDALYVDGRLTAEQMFIYCIQGKDKNAIEGYTDIMAELDDSKIPDEPCSFKQTSHSAAMIAAHITGFVTNFITNVKEGEDDRSVPFLWEYNIPLNMATETLIPYDTVSSTR